MAGKSKDNSPVFGFPPYHGGTVGDYERRMMKKDVLVLGGGAAGLFCAAEAAKRGRSVAVLEHNSRIGRKIVISGGGRCNFTNLHTSPDHYISQNPRFCISALRRYTPQDFLSLLQEYAIAWNEKKLGQLFCDEGSMLIVNMLQQRCEESGVEILLNCQIERAEKTTHFHVHTSQGILEADTVIVATGGASLTKVGATDIGYRLAQVFGLMVIPIRPGLVPLIFSGDDFNKWAGLQGVSIPVSVRCGKVSYEENLLFTHNGLSGPAVLQISNHWKKGEDIHVNWFPGTDARAFLEENRSRAILFGNLLSERFPDRFAQRFSEIIDKQKPMKQFSPKELDQVALWLSDWIFKMSETDGYQKAEITVGGVDTREISPKTMESKKIPGLYFIGEVLDVTGELGGYNFQWAWSSGYAAGQAV